MRSTTTSLPSKVVHHGRHPILPRSDLAGLGERATGSGALCAPGHLSGGRSAARVGDEVPGVEERAAVGVDEEDAAVGERTAVGVGDEATGVRDEPARVGEQSHRIRGRWAPPMGEDAGVGEGHRRGGRGGRRGGDEVAGVGERAAAG
uniref:Uncharacterized protein n=1 Tax=Setaria viridis TaxID=4556 RepID=A0A4U6VPI8_SETVI|nr:hypothetical protein SEVIR_2G062800v2 [Setaria viridis]